MFCFLKKKQAVLKRRTKKGIKAVLLEGHLHEVCILVEEEKAVKLKQDFKEELQAGRKVKLSGTLKTLEFKQLSDFYILHFTNRYIVTVKTRLIHVGLIGLCSIIFRLIRF